MSLQYKQYIYIYLKMYTSMYKNTKHKSFTYTGKQRDKTVFGQLCNTIRDDLEIEK